MSSEKARKTDDGSGPRVIDAAERERTIAALDAITANLPRRVSTARDREVFAAYDRRRLAGEPLYTTEQRNAHRAKRP